MGTVSVGFPRVWYFLITSMTKVNESTLSSSAEEGTQDGPLRGLSGRMARSEIPLRTWRARARQEKETSLG